MAGTDQFAGGSTPITLVTTAEAVLTTLTGVSPIRGSARILLNGWAQITSGTNTTAITLRIRRDSLTGGIIGSVNPITLPTVAGGTDEFELWQFDNRGDGNFTYVLTAQQAAASANGSALQYFLKASPD